MKTGDSSRRSSIGERLVSVEAALVMAARTDAGRVRELNEDSIEIDPAHGLAVLADGMGGYEGGEVASALAVAAVKFQVRGALETLVRGQVEPESGLRYESLVLRDAIAEANREVFSRARADQQRRSMGTTVVASLFSDNVVAVGHVGDSRCYRFHDDALQRLTTDHSVVQQFIDSGLYNEEEARATFNKNLVTRALGAEAHAAVDLTETEAAVGDVFLMCSDGLTDMLGEADIEKVLRRMADPGAAADRLLQLANNAGGKDNISVILVKVAESFGIDDDWQTRLVRYFDPR